MPKVDVLVSAIFRSQANAQPGRPTSGTNGASRTATYRMTAAQFLAATGRPLATGLATQDVDLLLPGAVYGDRINVVDMRFAKVLRFGKTKANVGLDVYNLFNSQHADDLRDGVRPGDERGAMDAADGRAAAAIHAVQRAVGFLIVAGVESPAANRAP